MCQSCQDIFKPSYVLFFGKIKLGTPKFLFYPFVIGVFDWPITKNNKKLIKLWTIPTQQELPLHRWKEESQQWDHHKKQNKT